jgi:hypothetical protein
MKKIQYLFVIIFSSLFISSCEEVITLDLKTGEEKYVIEAVLTNQAGQAKVSISRTKSFSAEGSFTGETGAIVTIEDEKGILTRLYEQTKGIYTDTLLIGLPETSYKLKVEINGQTFTGSSKMPIPVKVDSVYYRELPAFDGSRKFTHVRFKDPMGKGNFYRFVEYRNGVYNKSVTVVNDDLIDGNTVNQILTPRDFTDETKLNMGDKVKIDLLTIDPFVYRYWFSVSSGAQGNGESATPVNPVSNLTGGALGYFSAHTFQTKGYEVK